MLLLKRRILLFLSKLSVLHNNPSEYFQKHKISKTKHSLQREVQWLKTTIIMLFLHCPKCQLFVDISVWYLFEHNQIYLSKFQHVIVKIANCFL